MTDLRWYKQSFLLSKGDGDCSFISIGVILVREEVKAGQHGVKTLLGGQTT